MGPRGAAGWRSSASAAAIPGAAKATTRFHDKADEDSDLNDNKNMILAIVFTEALGILALVVAFIIKFV